MRVYYYCNKINDNFFNHKINLDKLDLLINKNNLSKIGDIKEYWINNVQIISDKKNVKFYKTIDKNISYHDNNYLIQELYLSEIQPFNFFKINLENEYFLYENIINDIKISLKKYNDYITLEYRMDKLININNFLYYNII